ncbi:MAG: hypothetical protein AABY32_06885 [Nanoarchaeota archaeon]
MTNKIIKNIKKWATIGSLALAGSVFYSGEKSNLFSYLNENSSKNIYLTNDSLTNETIKLISANYFDIFGDSTNFEKSKVKYENYRKSELERIIKKDEGEREIRRWEKGFYLTQDSLNVIIKKAYANVKVWPKEFDKRLFRILIRHESSRNIYAESSTGYLGLGQNGGDVLATFRPEEYKKLIIDTITQKIKGVEVKKILVDSVELKRILFDPIISIELSLQNLNHISYFCERFHPRWNELSLEEQWKIELTCYNAGPTKVRDDAKWNINSRKLKRENRKFADLVMKAYHNPKIKIKT